MNYRVEVQELLDGLVEGNPDRTQLAEFREWLAPGGQLDQDRFAAVMIFGTRLVAFVPAASEVFIEQVSALSGSHN